MSTELLVLCREPFPSSRQVCGAHGAPQHQADVPALC